MNTIEWNQTFIIGAYSITWLVLLGYLARLVRKGAGTRSDFERMSRENNGVENQ